MTTALGAIGTNDMHHTRYSEYPPPRLLAGHLRCSWLSETGNDAPAYSRRIIPDGCLDIILIGGERLVVVGPATRAEPVALLPGARYVGVRFHPGAAPVLLGVPACDLLDRTVALDDVWGRGAIRWLEQMLAARTPDGVLATLHGALLDRLPSAGAPDELVLAAADCLTRRPEVRLHALSDELGVSERQLLRRFRAAVGYGPKMFQRVARLQRAIRLAGETPVDRYDLAILAAQSGYADQAHMTREFSELAGATPARYFSDAAGVR